MTAVVNLPPGPRWPLPVQGLAYIAARRRMMHVLAKRYGTAFTVRLPFFGPTVIISDPALVKQFFQTRTDVVRNVEPNLDLVLGPGSTFGLQDQEHRRRRKLLVPPFHGKRMRAYEDLVEEETLKEVATWPERREFEVLTSTNRITLNVILRAVFGAEGAEFDALRKVMPQLVALGSQLVFLPWLHRDLGAWSPWGRFLGLRKQFDTIVGSLIDRVAADPNLENRDDVLSLMLQSRYEDGTAMSRSDLADELSPCSRPDTKPPQRNWHGQSNGCVGIRTCCRGWLRRSTPAARTCYRPPSTRCSATGPSSTAPPGRSSRRRCRWGSG